MVLNGSSWRMPSFFPKRISMLCRKSSHIVRSNSNSRNVPSLTSGSVSCLSLLLCLICVNAGFLQSPEYLSSPSQGRGEHECVINSTQSLLCFGLNDVGQLGLGDVISRASWTQVLVRPVQAVSLGYKHTCALMDGSILLSCWGLNDHGQLGLGDTLNRDTTPAPTAYFPRAQAIVELSLGHSHSCALLQDTSVKCWGYVNPF
jgi:Regulator of chromosome condensation (RCC1) repeat